MFEKMLGVENNKDNYAEAIGISKERGRELAKKTLKICEDCDKTSEVLDKIWNSNEYTYEEKVFLTYKAGMANGASLVKEADKDDDIASIASAFMLLEYEFKNKGVEKVIEDIKESTKAHPSKEHLIDFGAERLEKAYIALLKLVNLTCEKERDSK